MTIADPAVSDGMANTSYGFVWTLWTANVLEEKTVQGIGVFNATTLKNQDSDELSFDTKIGMDEIPNLESIATSWSAQTVSDFVLNGFIPLLKQGKNAVTVKNFGFVNF